ncbi:MAG: thiamine pyrophosphate-binding protein [Polyangiaceae bacterium]|nr:thiamine pyrophosphate-binding protein [Polyangiaceae bacterium]
MKALVSILIQEGVKYIFGIPGSHTCPLFDEADASGQIKLILTRHEQGAAYMADGYARVARQVGVCTGTVGPGATNLITGVAASYADGIPVVVITGMTPAATVGRTAHQEASGIGRAPNQVELFRNVTKTSLAVGRASKIPELLRTAFRIALNGRFGPVNLSIPSDTFYDGIPFEEVDRSAYRVTRSNNVDPALVRQAVEIIAGARRPLILAGQRCLFPDATRQLRELAEQAGIPVVTPLSAKGAFDEHHPLALGCLGLVGERTAEKYLREVADVVIAIGENFEEWTSLSWDPEIITGKSLIHIDVDPLEIGKNYPVTVGIDGTIRRILAELRNQLLDIEYSPNGSLDEVVALKASWGYFDSPEMGSDAVPIKPQRVMRELQEALPSETIVFGDSGHTVRWVGRCFKSRPMSFHAANIFEPMGYGVAACIGGKLAAPDRPVVSICGDGSFLMNGMEISTAANYDIPVVWIILNDARLNMVYHAQSIYYADRHVATAFKNPDYVKFAEAFGCAGFLAERPEEIKPAVAAALASGRPAIVDIHIDPDEVPPLRPRALMLGKDLRLPEPTITRAAVQTLTKMMREK